jgi:hypothetical protein
MILSPVVTFWDKQHRLVFRVDRDDVAHQIIVLVGTGNGKRHMHLAAAVIWLN